MLRYLSDYKRESVLAPLFKMLEATFDLFVPLVMADIVNVGIAAHDFHYILVRCGILLLLAIVGLTCSLTAQYFSAKAAVGYSTGLRHALFEHIQTLSFSEMDTMGTSTLITRMTSDVNQVQSGLNLFLRLFLRSPFVVFGAMIMAFTVNFRAALIFVVAIPLLSVVVFGVMVITRPLYKSVQTRLDRVLGLTRENLTGVRVVRAFDKEKSEVDRFEDANELLTQMQLHVGHISALMNPLTYVIINLAIVALLYVGSIEINIGGMASGDVIALVNYMNQIMVRAGQAGQPHRSGEQGSGLCRPCAGGSGHQARHGVPGPAHRQCSGGKGRRRRPFRPCEPDLQGRRRTQPLRHQFHRQARPDHRRHRRHRQRQIQPHQPHPPLLRRH